MLLDKLSWVLWRWDGKRKESLQLCLWNLNIRIEKRWLVEMTSVMKSLPLFTLAHVFLMFDIYIRACFCFMLIDGTLTAQSTGSHLGIGGGIQTTWGRKGVKTWENRKQERSGGERGKSGRWEFLRWKVAEIERIYSTKLNILQSKKG